MYYLVVYYVRVNDCESCHFHSPFLHTSYESALAEADGKKFFGSFTVLDFYIDSVLLMDK